MVYFLPMTRAKIISVLENPIARSAFPRILEMTLTMSSDIDVPNETTVKPMTISDTFNRFAIADTPLTKVSAPLIRKTKPRIKKKYIINVFDPPSYS
jgi:hypothetical protein